MTDRKAYDDKYNASAKGQRRNRAYEARHPERRNRNRTGFIARDALRSNDAPEASPAEGDKIPPPGNEAVRLDVRGVVHRRSGLRGLLGPELPAAVTRIPPRLEEAMKVPTDPMKQTIADRMVDALTRIQPEDLEGVVSVEVHRVENLSATIRVRTERQGVRYFAVRVSEPI